MKSVPDVVGSLASLACRLFYTLACLDAILSATTVVHIGAARSASAALAGGTAAAAAASGPSSFSCPTACFCNAASRIVYCSRRGLTAVPDGLAADSLQLNLNGNAFQSTTLRRGNFSGMTALEHLYLSECGIERLEVGTFADLTRLLWLDLSNNRIRTLGDRQFAGLTLQHLFLNGNRHVDLRPSSFDGLSTTGLYLHDCSLSGLPVDVVAPLNSTLRYLWLNGNELTALSAAHRPLFAVLSHLRLGSNPLHCNCETAWLKDLYDSAPDVFRGAAAPSCLTPQRLRGRHFNEVGAGEFRCQAPAFSNIETAFGADVGGARLRCTATGDPAPTLYWIQPSGKTTRYGPPVEDEVRRNEGLLVVRETATSSVDSDPTSSSLFGMYICVANNEVGNVTLTINVSWPFSAPTTPSRAVAESGMSKSSAPLFAPTALIGGVSPSPRPPRTHRVPVVVATGTSTTESMSQAVAGADAAAAAGAFPHHTNYTVIDVTRPGSASGGSSSSSADDDDGVDAELVVHHQRLFTVTELVCAVIGTHVGTLVVCLVLVPLVYRRRRMLIARDKRDRAVAVAGLHPPAYGTTTTTNSTSTGGPMIPVGIGMRVGSVPPSQLQSDGNDCGKSSSSLYRHPLNGVPPAESVYLNGTPYSTARRHQQQQFYQQQPQPTFLTEYLLTTSQQRR